MSNENSIPTIGQRELASEYGKYVESKSDKAIMSVLIKALIIPLLTLPVILAGAAFSIANFSPALYTQAKDILFEKIDFEKITGQTDAVNKQYLDSWLVLNSEKYQVKGLAQEEQTLEEMVQQEQLERQPN